MRHNEYYVISLWHALHTVPSSKWSKSEAEIQTDTDDFLPPLRRLSPPPPANSHAKTACSDTLTEAGYARCGNENQPTVLSWILLQICPIYVMAPRATCAYNLTVIQLFVAHAVRRVNG